MYCTIAIIGIKKTYQLNPTPEKMQKIKMIKHEIKKLTKPLVVIDMGIISLGKYTFFIIPPFIKMVLVPCVITVVKNVHGIIPVITYMI